MGGVSRQARQETVFAEPGRVGAVESEGWGAAEDGKAEVEGDGVRATLLLLVSAAGGTRTKE